MAKQALAWRAVYFSCFVLIASCSSDAPPPHNQEHVSTTHNDVLKSSKNSSSTNKSTEHSVSKSPVLRSRRNTNLDNKDIFNREGSRALRSVFQYNDQIMRNLLQNHSPKPLSYARSNFILNLLKPLDRRTTRYSSWDDHSVLHFGKRSVDTQEAPQIIDKEINPSESMESSVSQFSTLAQLKGEKEDTEKRSPYPWSDHNTMHFGKRSEDSNSGSSDAEIKVKNNDEDSLETSNHAQEISKKSEIPWNDHNTLHFGKRPDDPWHSMMSFGKRDDDPWHSMMSFGKREDDPWHSMMSFDKRGEHPFDDHSTMHFGKRDDEPWHSMMSFGKRGESPFDDHNTLHFGKREDEPWHSMMSFGKRGENPFEDHNTMHFGKREDEPWHSMMSFGKRSKNPFEDHNTMHFGKREDDPWHSMMSFGKRGENLFEDHNTMHFGKKDGDPWHSMMSFGKRNENPFDDHSTLHFGKRNDDPWHSMMSFGKRSENPFNDHSTMHFGKRDDDPWHSMMSFGKKSENSWENHNTLHFGKRGENPFDDHSTMHFGKKDEPWHSMMSFGKRGENPFGDHNTLHFGKRDDDPWHSMMSFGKRGENPFDDHSTLHFGKRDDEPWHSMMSFGKRGEHPFDDHSTMHFGKRDDEPWHSMMSFGKRSENPFYDHSTMHFGKRDEDPWHSMMSFGKKSENSWENHNTLQFGGKSDKEPNTLKVQETSKNSENSQNKIPATKHNKKRSIDSDELSSVHDDNKIQKYETKPGIPTKQLRKRNDPWDNHNTLHFGKKSMWWMSPDFGKKFDPWNTHNTMHFGKKSNYWDTHNTMHFGKRSKLKDSHNEALSQTTSKDSLFDSNEKTVTMENFNGILDDSIYDDSKEQEPELDEKAGNLLVGKYEKRSIRSPGRNSAFKIQGDKKLQLEKRSTNKMQKNLSNRMNFRGNPAGMLKDFKKLENVAPVANEVNNVKSVSNKATNNIQAVKIKKEFNTKENHVKKRSIEQIPLEINENKQNSGQFTSQNQETENYEEEPSTDLILQFAEIPEEFPVGSMKDLDKAVSRQTYTQLNNKYKPLWGTIDEKRFNKKFDPWSSHNTMHFGKRFDPLELHNTMHFGKRFDPLELHNTMHFGKKNDPWNSHNTMHFGKRSDPWELHNTMHFGKKADPWESHNTLHFGKKSDPWESHYTMHFGKRSDPWESHNTLHFGKKSDPWENHNTLHFGKKSDPWENHNTLHFGKKSDPWETHNTLHFGKKSDPWELHNTLHFGKKSDPWENHNTLHFGKRDRSDETVSDMLVWMPNREDVSYDSEIASTKLLPTDSETNSKKSSSDDSVDPRFHENFGNILSSEENPGIIFDRIPDMGSTFSDFTPPVLFQNYNDLDKNGMFLLQNLLAHLPEGINSNGVLGMLDKIQRNPELSSVLDTNQFKDSDGAYLLEPRGNDFSDNYQKIKQKLLKKPGAKRYWAAPFQGPKSIVYPHAWLASQIRRSAVPKSIDPPRFHETRTAEKKEDPVNSFMHFGRR